MSEKSIRLCDECSKEWTPSNHWFSVFPTHDGDMPMFCTLIQAEREDTSNVRLDFCGQQCAMKAFSRWMDTKSVLKQVAVME